MSENELAMTMICSTHVSIDCLKNPIVHKKKFLPFGVELGPTSSTVKQLDP